jgi:hypothetical protein
MSVVETTLPGGFAGGSVDREQEVRARMSTAKKNRIRTPFGTFFRFRRSVSKSV